MPIPPLNEYKLLPPGIHQCSFSEIESVFAYNSQRKHIWDKFIEFFNLIKDFSEIRSLYFDGSFVTDTDTPGDLDIVIEFFTLYDWGRLKRANSELFDDDLVKSNYLVDYLPCAPEMMPWQGADPRRFFQGLKVQEIERRQAPKGATKGILAVILRGGT